MERPEVIWVTKDWPSFTGGAGEWESEQIWDDDTMYVRADLLRALADKGKPVYPDEIRELLGEGR